MLDWELIALFGPRRVQMVGQSLRGGFVMENVNGLKNMLFAGSRYVLNMMKFCWKSPKPKLNFKYE